MLTKKELRNKLRQKRRSLSRLQQRTASIQLKNHLNVSGLLLRAKHIALYLSNDGEICPMALMQSLWKRNKYCYLPAIHPLKENHLVFCRVTPATRFEANRFGIPEPVFRYSQKLPARHLSLVLLPLVAFDPEGNRMGMGGGYYDRTFGFKQLGHQSIRTPPKLVGLAHELQKQDQLAVDSWDIPLCGIITDKRIYL